MQVVKVYNSLSATENIPEDGRTMADEGKNKRVAELVQNAQSARRRDSNQEAADAVREALSIDPDNDDARKLFEGLNLSGGNAIDVLKVCRDYHEGTIGKDGFRQVIQGAAIDVEGTRETFEFTFEHKDERSDEIVEALLSKPNGSRAIVPMLMDEPTATFRALWDLGEASMRALIQKILLQPAAWNKEDQRRKAEKDVMMLLLAKLLEAGQEKPELAMLAIARLLAVDADVVREVMDSDAYTVLFSALDQSNPQASRSQATVALAKLHESSPEPWEHELVSFVESMAKTQRTEKLIMACSAVSVLFPVAPPVCARMFLREGFVQQLIHLVINTGSSRFKEAALELFSAACVDSQCRKTIQTYCGDWLSEMSTVEDTGARQSKIAVTAALVTSKLRDDSKKAGGADDRLVQTLKRIVLDNDATSDAKEKAIEGLQYQTVHAKVKENLINDAKFLKQLIAFLSKPEAVSNAPLTYVGLNVFQNLTRYPPILSQEQSKIEELKAYANKTPLPRTHPLDEEGPVSERCTKALAAGVASLLVLAFKKASLSLHLVISSITLALSKYPKHRGRMAKEGLFDLALTQATSDINKRAPLELRRQSALACARIMIPIDPNLLFKGRDIRPIVRVLLYLIKSPEIEGASDQMTKWWRGFPVVTGIQALTNLATFQESPSDPEFTANYIIDESWTTLEDLWTDPAIQLRTAVTECFVNLAMVDEGAARFITEGESSKRRMRILVGYWSEGGNLAQAAGGALAIILGTADRRAVELFLSTESGMYSTAEAILSNDPSMNHRGVAVAEEVLMWAEKPGDSTLANRILDAARKVKLPIALRKLKFDGKAFEKQAIHALNIMNDANLS